MFFIGGRVELFSLCADLQHRSNSHLKAYIIDVNAIYPYLSMISSFPYEAPKILVGRQLENIVLHNNKFYLKEGEKLHKIHSGICQLRLRLARQNKCRGIPFLPFRLESGKSIAMGCRDCAISQRRDFCECNDNKRAWLDVYSLEEIEIALDYGYEIVQIFEIYYWLKGDYLFTDFMKLLASIRLKATPVPSEWESQVEKYTQFINETLDLPKEYQLKSTELYPSLTVKNHCKYTMNVLLGKLLQREQQEQTKYIFEKSELDEIYSDPSNQIKNLELIDEDILKVCYEKRKILFKTNVKTNFYIGGMITAKARIFMFQTFMALSQSNAYAEALYTDTDSILLLTQKNAEIPIPIDTNLLGYFKHEFDITKYNLSYFGGFGPKNYFYVLQNSKDPADCIQISKVRGFSVVSEEAKDKLSIENMKVLIKALRDGKGTFPKMTLKQYQIFINSKKHSLVSKVLNKIYSDKAFNSKRWYNPHYHLTRTFYYGADRTEQNHYVRKF